jgi:tRNA1Val (adenine37-N6)-methyltransferase
MKVCTDSCVFGALLPTKVTDGAAVTNVLDIGTGTALLSLMYAQKNANCAITAIELDNKAAAQAGQNIANSRYKHRIQIHNADYFHYNFEEKFDLIICNPPFFKASLKSNNQQKNMAWHATNFDIAAGIKKIAGELSTTGIACVLLSAQHNEINFLHQSGLTIQKKILLYNNVTDNRAFRQILMLSKKPQIQPTEHFFIKEQNEYSTAFTKHLQPYYLYL